VRWKGDSFGAFWTTRETPTREILWADRIPKNTVSDPITDQEIAFARLILSGTMNDHRAAEAVGLNPDTAAYTKSKPRVRAYMSEHRAAVSERLVDQEAEGLRNLNHRQRDRGQYSFGVGKPTQRKSKAHTQR
jgi:hypothetical protein